LITWTAKDPSELLDYTFNFSADMASTETITLSVVAASDGVTVESKSDGDKTVTVFLSGGTINRTSKVDCTVTTNATPARTIKTSALLPIEPK
jgi:hypothetical protein